MSLDDLWNQWVEPYDLFVSYARADNAAEPHMVSALVEHIKADFARFSALRSRRPKRCGRWSTPSLRGKGPFRGTVRA